MALTAIGIVSAQLEASVRFYAALGVAFEPAVMENPGGHGPHVEGKTATGLRLMFDTVELVKKINPDWTQPSGGTRMAMCFEQAAPADVDRIFDAAVAAGAAAVKAPWDAFWGQRYSTVRDPDGNHIHIDFRV